MRRRHPPRVPSLSVRHIGIYLPNKKLLAQEMDSGFFAKVGTESKKIETDETLEMLRKLVKEHPKLVSELLSKVKDKT